MKVVIVVGPAGSNTANYKDNARRYAAQARSYGANVVEVYSPNATWSRVKAAAQGAKVLIYLGHGNGYPSPYGAFSKYTKDGFGLNRSAWNGNYNTKYWGEYYIRTQIDLAPNAVVILNRLCYASGNSEWGRANPTKTVAKQRVQNYASGFLAPARGPSSPKGSRTRRTSCTGCSGPTATIGDDLQELVQLERDATTSSSSPRGTPAFRAWMDPKSPGRYYRSVVGNFSLTAAAVRAS